MGRRRNSGQGQRQRSKVSGKAKVATMSNHGVQCVVTQYGVLCMQVSMQHEERREVGTGLLECLFDSQGVWKGELWRLIVRAYSFGE
jgi:hypothetical protein